MRPVVKVVVSASLIVTLGIIAVLVRVDLSNRKAEKIMACAIGKVWACPTESIRVASLGAATYRFTGCGHDSTYYCKMPAEGCLLENSKAVLPLSECAQ